MILWSKTFASKGNAFQPRVRETKDGGFVSASNGDPGFIFRLHTLDSQGRLLWVKGYPFADGSFNTTRDGGFILTAFIEKNRADLSILKLDAQGNIIWGKIFDGGRKEKGTAIQQTKDGGFIVAGETNSFGAGKREWWVLKLDSNGNCGGCRFNIQNAPRIVPHLEQVKVKNRHFSVIDLDVTADEINLTANDSIAISARQCGARIVSVSPKSARAGDTINIKGSGFGKTQGTSQVLFASVSAGTALSWSDTRIRVKVPDTAVTGPLNIQMNATVSGGQEFVILP